MEIKASDLSNAADALERMHKHYAPMAAAAATLRDLARLQGMAEEANAARAAAQGDLERVRIELAAERQALEETVDAGNRERDKARSDANGIVVDARKQAEETVAAGEAAADGIRRNALAETQDMLAEAKRILREGQDAAGAAAEELSHVERALNLRKGELAVVEEKIADLKAQAAVFAS